jgi:SAM-dependent methyltransferase/uncharacterized protein YbaR (Trm112 family)
MRKGIVEDGRLRGVRGGGPLTLEVFRAEGEHVMEGVLREDDGYWYPVIGGVPSFLRGRLRPDLAVFERTYGLAPVPQEPGGWTGAAEQARTNVTFSDKWRRFGRYGFEPRHAEFLFGWYCRKLGVADVDALKAFYRGKRMVLEVGPGSGFNACFVAENSKGMLFAVDISDAAFTTFENTRHVPNCHVVQADVMAMPFPDGTFDFVIADGVLHHTPDTRAALEAVLRKVGPGEQLFFHVYRKMGAARVFTDAFIRSEFGKLTPAECYEACEGLTELGRELSRLGAKVTLRTGVPVLGIPPGEHDVQRLLYYNFVKCFWNEAFDFETSNMVNFDWYHAHNAWQHTEPEVESWLRELGVTEYRFNDANPNGISVLLRRPR